jgi:hypothetical protein
MKKIALRAASLTLLLAIAFGIGSGVVRACQDVSGDGFYCSVTGEDADYCYYWCECYTDAIRCANRIGLAGIELI